MMMFPANVCSKIISYLPDARDVSSFISTNKEIHNLNFSQDIYTITCWRAENDKLTAACRNNDVNAVCSILDKNILDQECYKSAFLLSCELGQEKIVELFIQKKFDVAYYASDDGLIKAAATGDLLIMELLYYKFADFSTDYDDNKRLQVACENTLLNFFSIMV